MITSDQAIVVFDRGRAIPDRLTRGRHGHYLELAERMLAVYRTGPGRTRRELHRAVERVFADEPDCPSRRIAAFCKLLDDAGEFDADPDGYAARLRLEVFTLAAAHHPLVRSGDRLYEKDEAAVKSEIAARLGRSWEEVDAALYADVIDLQRLGSFRGFEGAEALLSAYNVAQLQACLYRAERMAVVASGDFRTILRHATFARLLFTLDRLGPSLYRFDFSGPASVLAETRRYGVNFARFLPALLACRGWELRAEVRTPWKRTAALELSDRDGYRSHLEPPPEFDSSVEARFAKKFGAEREGWRLSREGEVLHEGQSTFVPDFVFRHADGTEALMEIVGFWTPEYLAKKRETLRRFGRHRVLLAVAESALRSKKPLPEGVVSYKTALKPEAVLAALEKLRGRP